jgi:hypothetical protein
MPEVDAGTMVCTLPFPDVFLSTAEEGHVRYRLRITEEVLALIEAEARELVDTTNFIFGSLLQHRADGSLQKIDIASPRVTLERDGRAFLFKSQHAEDPGPSFRMLRTRTYGQMLSTAANKVIFALLDKDVVRPDPEPYTEAEADAVMTEQSNETAARFGLTAEHHVGVYEAHHRNETQREILPPKVEA